jgi:LAO/AO transport system kinase
LITRFLRGDRKALAQVITLTESTAIEDQNQLSSLLMRLGGTSHETIRVAISGPPGVGKSTLINTLGQKIVAQFKLAVLPIDPSSDVSFGSILGDKTRMKDLLLRDDVYVRPSPAKGALGGLSLTTPDVVYVVEAFGFDFIIVETVGVGQTEMLAHNLTDHFVVLMQPGAGDQLQAMKKGIIERADFVLVNKADGEQENLAKKTLASLRALSHHAGKTAPYVASLSALDDVHVDSFFEDLLKRHRALVESGALAKERVKKRSALCEHIFAQVCAQRIMRLKSLASECQRLAHESNALHQALGPQVMSLVDDVIKKLS